MAVILSSLKAEQPCPFLEEGYQLHHSSQIQEQATCYHCIYQVRNLPSRVVKRLENRGENVWLGSPFEMM